MVPVLGGLCINTLSFRKGEIGIFLIPKLLLVFPIHRLSNFIRYRLDICFRMQSVLYFRRPVFAIMLC